jgi:hypothetical protein
MANSISWANEKENCVLLMHSTPFTHGAHSRPKKQVGNLSEHARRKSIWRHILGVFRGFIWFKKLIEQHFNERKLCNI